MFEKLTVREQYRQAYRAVRLQRLHIGENGYVNHAQQMLIIDLISEYFGMMSLKAYTSAANSHSGITVNWRLRDRLQDFSKKKHVPYSYDNIFQI